MKNQIVRKVGLAVAVLFVLTGTLFGQVETSNNSVPAATEIVVPAETSNSVPANAAPKNLSIDDLEELDVSSFKALGRTFSRPDLLGEAMKDGLYWGIILAFCIALFGIAYWTPKQIKAEKEYTLPCDDSAVSEEEMRALTLGETRMIDFEKKISNDRDDGTAFEYLADARDVYAAHDRLQELSRKSLSPEEKKVLNLEIRTLNQTLFRQDASVLPSKTLRVFWGIFWGVLFLHGGLNIWEGHIMYGLFAIIATVAFMIARHNSYKILTPDFLQHYHGDWIVKIYEGFWKFVGAATAVGVAAGASEAQKTNVTLYVDNDGDVVGYKKESGAFLGGMIMVMSLACGFLAGFFMFVFVQPVLIFYLFWRYYYSRLPKTNASSFPMKRNPMILYVPAAVCGIMFLGTSFFTNISLQKEAIWSEIASGRPQTAEAIAAEPIFEACRDELVTPERMASIIKAGADVNANVKGMTPLTIAVIHQNSVATKALLDAGANPDFVMLNNMKISDYATRRGNDEMKKLFQENVAGTQK